MGNFVYSMSFPNISHTKLHNVSISKVSFFLQELIKNIMYFWQEYKMYSMHLPSLKTFGEHQENLMYLNDIIFIKYFMYLCDFPRVFQGGKLSCFPSDIGQGIAKWVGLSFGNGSWHRPSFSCHSSLCNPHSMPTSFRDQTTKSSQSVQLWTH